uniref:Uncharacterized protein n=1 Tax=Caenorhabditis japonica TaxID=281687 RepID=A0A8R1IFM8_CAEJA
MTRPTKNSDAIQSPTALISDARAVINECFVENGAAHGDEIHERSMVIFEDRKMGRKRKEHSREPIIRRFFLIVQIWI